MEAKTAPALDRVEVVLCRTRHGGNVGAAARAVANMGLGGLVLAAPEEFHLSEARMFAAGASRVLEKAPSFDSLAQALEGYDLVLGTSRRVRSGRVRIMTPGEAARHIVENLGAGRAALVFGPEDSGLTVRELGLCHGVVSIPADERCPSLNLAQAVMVTAWEIRKAACPDAPVRSFGGPSEEEWRRALAQVESVLDLSGFFRRNARERVLLHLREILRRGITTSQDARIVRGIFGSLAWALVGKDSPKGEEPGEES